MKALFLILLVFAGTNTSVLAQEEPYENYDVDSLPEFPGGMQELYGFLSENLSFGTVDSACQSFKVFVEFVVNPDGTLSDFESRKDDCPSLARALFRVLRKSPPWKPALKDGVPVATRFVIPLHIHPG